MKTHPFLLLSACCLLAAHTAHAATMAAQPWVTNRIAEAEARMDAKITAATNAIPAPVVDLTPATNYTDTAVSAMGSVLRDTIAETAQASTNYTDAVAAEFESGARTAANANGALQANYAESAGEATSATWAARLSDGGGVGADNLTYSDIIGGFFAATNGVPEAIGRKQDALPYPTNAIPYAAISGAPSSGWQEWRVDNQSSYEIHYVTNGMANVQMGAELSCNTNGWGDGAAMFARFTIQSGLSYEVMDPRIRLVGYGKWPTNNFQSVWWRSGATIYVNILVED